MSSRSLPPLRSLQLGAITVNTPVVLAPMAGVTDQAFRRLCRGFAEAGAQAGRALQERGSGEEERLRTKRAPGGLFVNEMVTARALLEGNQSSWAMVEPDPDDPVRSLQLYGSHPQTLEAATRLLIRQGIADHIDLNFGCPVPKVTRKGGGAAIPWKRDLFEDIVTSVVRAADEEAEEGPGSVPVTVKMRIGIDDDHITVFDAARRAQDAGVAAVALHARTQEQYYSGAARWEYIARLKSQLRIPVFGNGDVFSGDEAVEMMAQTGCDAVVVGRGCQGRPWLFEEISRAMWGAPASDPPDLAHVCQILQEHAELAVHFDGNEARAIKELRKHVGWYLRGFAIGGEARRSLSLVSTYDELCARLADLDQDQSFPAVAAGSRGRKGTSRRPHLPYGWLDQPYLSAQERSLLDDSVSVDGG